MRIQRDLIGPTTNRLPPRQDRARIVFDCRMTDDPARWIPLPKYRMIRHNDLESQRIGPF
jgi:hypothetical protein